MKQTPPSPTITRAGTKYAGLNTAASNKNAAKNKQVSAVRTGINGILLEREHVFLHTAASKTTLLEIL